MRGVLVLVACLSTATTIASAQAVPTEDVASARQLFRQGLVEARAGRWDAARALFERSHVIAPRDATLLNLARAEMETGHLVRARERFTQYLYSSGDDVEPGRREALRASIAELNERVALVRVVLSGATDSVDVSVQGRVIPVSELGIALPVDPGAVEIRVSRDDQTVLTRTFRLDEGGRREVRLRVPLTPSEPAATDAPEPEDSNGEAWALGLGLSGAVAVGVAVALGVVFAVSAGSTEEPTFTTSGTIATFTLP